MKKRADKVTDSWNFECVYPCVRLKLVFSLCLRVHFFTWTRGDVTLLILLRWPQAGLSSIPGLWVTAGPLPAADSPAAVSAALGPGTPGRPAAVHRVA